MSNLRAHSYSQPAYECPYNMPDYPVLYHNKSYARSCKGNELFSKQLRLQVTHTLSPPESTS